MPQTQAQLDQENLEFIRSRQEKKFRSSNLACSELSLISSKIQYIRWDKNYNPEVSAAYFNLATKIAKEYPGQVRLGFLTQNGSYSVDASGEITRSGKKVTEHPLGELAKVAPKEFKEFVITSIANEKDSDKYSMNEIFKSREIFGLSQADLADITHQIIKKRQEMGKEPIDAAHYFIHEPSLLQELSSKYPEDFSTMAKQSAKGGFAILLTMGDGEERPTHPVMQTWIDQHPKDYAEIVQTAINQHCPNYHKFYGDSREKAEFDGIIRMTNKRFLASNPDFAQKAYVNLQNHEHANSGRSY